MSIKYIFFIENLYAIIVGNIIGLNNVRQGRSFFGSPLNFEISVLRYPSVKSTFK